MSEQQFNENYLPDMDNYGGTAETDELMEKYSILHRFLNMLHALERGQFEHALLRRAEWEWNHYNHVEVSDAEVNKHKHTVSIQKAFIDGYMWGYMCRVSGKASGKEGEFEERTQDP